jgi:predicted DCC family thiol-disulfide oxidoreductase YuxK
MHRAVNWADPLRLKPQEVTRIVLRRPAMASETKSPSPLQLPSPQQRPDADIVIFDGNCGFCQRQVRRLNRWDWGKHLAYLSLHDPQVAARWPELRHEQLMREMYVVDRLGNKWAGPAALRYLSRRLPPLWPAAPLLHLPGSEALWRRLYDWVAQRRYGLSGAAGCPEGTCQLHRAGGDGPPQRK